MNISLPVPLKQWVAKQVTEKGYSTASEYVRDVLRKEHEQEARAAIDTRLNAAIASGPSTPLDPRSFEQIRKQGLKLAGSRRKK